MSLSTQKICAFCGKPPRKDETGNDIKMKTCSRCKSVYYHDVECQKQHWKVHKKICGKPETVKAASKPARPKQAHRSADTVHQRVTRRFKELRKEGVPVQEAMQRARMEFQPPDNMDAGSKGEPQLSLAVQKVLESRKIV